METWFPPLTSLGKQSDAVTLLELDAPGHVGQNVFFQDSTRSNRSKETHLSCYLMEVILIQNTHTSSGSLLT